MRARFTDDYGDGFYQWGWCIGYNCKCQLRGIFMMSTSFAMPVEVNARFENGVLVLEGKVPLEDHQRVTLRISPTVLPRYDDPKDPRPAGGIELADWWARHRLQVTPDIAKIATDPE